MIPYLTELASQMNGITHGDLSCHDNTLYYIVGTFRTDYNFYESEDIFYQHERHTIAGKDTDSYYKLDLNNLDSAAFKENLLRLYCALMEGHAVKIFGFDLSTDPQANMRRFLCIFDKTGVLMSRRTTPNIGKYYEPNLNEDSLIGIETKLNEIMKDFFNLRNLPTMLPKMSRGMFINKLSLIKMILKDETRKITTPNRWSNFKQFINFEKINDFIRIYPLLVDIDKWEDWYNTYITNSMSNPLRDNGIKEFLSIIIKDFNPNWYDHPGDYDFEIMWDIRNNRAFTIELQPWFSNEFLVLNSYLPNILWSN